MILQQKHANGFYTFALQFYEATNRHILSCPRLCRIGEGLADVVKLQTEPRFHCKNTLYQPGQTGEEVQWKVPSEKENSGKQGGLPIPSASSAAG